MHHVNYQGTRATFQYSDEYATYCFELSLQCSGAVLVELRRFGSSGSRHFYSKYASKLIREGFIDDRMYGGNNKYGVPHEAQATIAVACGELRRNNTFDPSLGAGDTIQEMFH